MHVKKSLLIRAVAGIAVAVGAFGGAGLHTVHASNSGSDPCGAGAASDTIDPILTQNRLTALANTTREWDDICSWSATNTGSALNITVNTFANLPSFPVAANGDLGANVEICSDIDSGVTISNGPAQIGVGHHGTPIFDGPYNSADGWKICASVSVTAPGDIVDCELSIFDPIGQFTFFDSPQIQGGVPCAWGRLALPFTWNIIVPPPSAPEQGITRTDSYTWIPSGGTAHNLVIETQASVGVTLPTTVCVPSPTCSILGPITGVGGLLFTVDWAPGEQLCTTPVLNCINNPGGFTLGLAPLGFPISAVVSCGTPNLQSTCPTPIVGTVNYDPCFAGPGTNGTQDTGDLFAIGGSTVCGVAGGHTVPWPYHYEAVNGRTILPGAAGEQIAPQFLPDCVNT